MRLPTTADWDNRQRYPKSDGGRTYCSRRDILTCHRRECMLGTRKNRKMMDSVVTEWRRLMPVRGPVCLFGVFDALFAVGKLLLSRSRRCGEHSIRGSCRWVLYLFRAFHVSLRAEMAIQMAKKEGSCAPAVRQKSPPTPGAGMG